MPAPQHLGLVVRLEQIVEAAATAVGAHLAVDARLDAVADDLMRSTKDSSSPSPRSVDYALRKHGIIDPIPQIIVVTSREAIDSDGLLEDLNDRLRRALLRGRYNRLGIAASEADAQPRAIIALGEHYVETEPFPHSLVRGAPVELRGRALAPFRTSNVMASTPSGSVENLRVVRDRESFRVALPCSKKGQYRIEIVGEDSAGPKVLANFPIWCGVPPELGPVPSDPESEELAGPEARTAEAIEQQCLRLLNADRARNALPALTWDSNLARVARAHAADMKKYDFVGHVSPRGGDILDRLGSPRGATMVLENVARAYSAEEAERSWMGSPGHRANILSYWVTHVGIGVVLGRQLPDARELFIDQLFVRRANTLPWSGAQ